jgi:hypothetical protein
MATTQSFAESSLMTTMQTLEQSQFHYTIQSRQGRFGVSPIRPEPATSRSAVSGSIETDDSLSPCEF